MTEESQQRKESARPIGGIGRQYASIGGKGTQMSELPNAQPLEHLNIQTSRIPNAQKSKRSKRERDKMTVYLDAEVNTWIRHR